MSIHRHCEVKQGSYLQRGRGAGGVLKSLYNQLVPIAKNVGEQLLIAPETKETLNDIKNSVTDAGINLILDKLSKKRLKESLTSNLSRVQSEIGESVKQNTRKAIKRGVGNAISGVKAKISRADIFDDNSLDDDQMSD